MEGVTFTRATLSAIGLAVVVILLSVVRGQGSTNVLQSEAPRPPDGPQALLVPANAPHLTKINPAHASIYDAYTKVTLHGTGFMPTNNIVIFGQEHITRLPAVNGTKITFGIPTLPTSNSEVSPFKEDAQPGNYEVRVTTSEGTSNALIFTFTPGP